MKWLMGALLYRKFGIRWRTAKEDFGNYCSTANCSPLLTDWLTSFSMISDRRQLYMRRPRSGMLQIMRKSFRWEKWMHLNHRNQFKTETKTKEYALEDYRIVLRRESQWYWSGVFWAFGTDLVRIEEAFCLEKNICVSFLTLSLSLDGWASQFSMQSDRSLCNDLR